MFLLLQNLVSVLRGLTVICVASVSGKNIRMGKFLRMMKGGVLRWRGNAAVTVGNRVKLENDAVVSALNGGHLSLGNNVTVGRRNMVVCHENITIGDGTIMAPDVLIYDHDHVFNKEEGVKHREYTTMPVTIGKNCWIGAGTIILKGTVIEDNCIVGAGCVLKGTYEKGSVIIQKRETVIRSM